MGELKIDRISETEAARHELQQARVRLSVATRALKADLQWLKVPSRLSRAVSQRPWLWVGGALVVGAVLGALSNGSTRRDHGSE